MINLSNKETITQMAVTGAESIVAGALQVTGVDAVASVVIPGASMVATGAKTAWWAASSVWHYSSDIYNGACALYNDPSGTAQEAALAIATEAIGAEPPKNVNSSVLAVAKAAAPLIAAKTSQALEAAEDGSLAKALYNKGDRIVPVIREVYQDPSKVLEEPAAAASTALAVAVEGEAKEPTALLPRAAQVVTEIAVEQLGEAAAQAVDTLRKDPRVQPLAKREATIRQIAYDAYQKPTEVLNDPAALAGAALDVVIKGSSSRAGLGAKAAGLVTELAVDQFGDTVAQAVDGLRQDPRAQVLAQKEGQLRDIAYGIYQDPQAALDAVTNEPGRVVQVALNAATSKDHKEFTGPVEQAAALVAEVATEQLKDPALSLLGITDDVKNSNLVNNNIRPLEFYMGELHNRLHTSEVPAPIPTTPAVEETQINFESEFLEQKEQFILRANLLSVYQAVFQNILGQEVTDGYKDYEALMHKAVNSQDPKKTLFEELQARAKQLRKEKKISRHQNALAQSDSVLNTIYSAVDSYVANFSESFFEDVHTKVTAYKSRDVSLNTFPLQRVTTHLSDVLVAGKVKPVRDEAQMDRATKLGVKAYLSKPGFMGTCKKWRKGITVTLIGTAAAITLAYFFPLFIFLPFLWAALCGGVMKYDSHWEHKVLSKLEILPSILGSLEGSLYNDNNHKLRESLIKALKKVHADLYYPAPAEKKADEASPIAPAIGLEAKRLIDTVMLHVGTKKRTPHGEVDTLVSYAGNNVQRIEEEMESLAEGNYLFTLTHGIESLIDSQVSSVLTDATARGYQDLMQPESIEKQTIALLKQVNTAAISAYEDLPKNVESKAQDNANEIRTLISQILYKVIDDAIQDNLSGYGVDCDNPAPELAKYITIIRGRLFSHFYTKVHNALDLIDRVDANDLSDRDFFRGIFDTLVIDNMVEDLSQRG